MAICSSGSPACCCQPAVAGGFIYADRRSELNIYLAPQVLFTHALLGPMPLLQAFPFPSTLGEVTLHQLSRACVFIYSSHGSYIPPLLWSLPPTGAFTSFPTLDCWVCAAAPAFSSCLVRDFPSLSSVLRVPHPLCYMSFLLLLLIIQFLFFSLGGGCFVQGAILIWPRIVCGSNM
jgi:hypothetical protein